MESNSWEEGLDSRCESSSVADRTQITCWLSFHSTRNVQFRCSLLHQHQDISTLPPFRGHFYLKEWKIWCTARNNAITITGFCSYRRWDDLNTYSELRFFSRYHTFFISWGFSSHSCRLFTRFVISSLSLIRHSLLEWCGSPARNAKLHQGCIPDHPMVIPQQIRCIDVYLYVSSVSVF